MATNDYSEASAEEEQSARLSLPQHDVTWGRRLGDGAHGTVWEATDQLLQRTMAVKFLTGTDEAYDVEALLRDARTLAKLSHPNLVTTYGVAALPDTPRRGFVRQP